MDKYKKSVFTSEFSTFPFPTWCGTFWFLQVTPGGARAEQEHSTNTSTKSKKEQLREQEKKGSSDIQ